MMYCTVERGRKRDNGGEMGKGKDMGRVGKGSKEKRGWEEREGICMSPEESKNVIVKEIVK